MSRMMKILFILTIIGVFVSGCGSNQTAEELFSGAENARNEKDIKTQYLIGDIYMNDLRDFDSAIAAYVDVVNNFSGTNQEAQAQFMIGYIYANILNDNSQAELNYKNFLDRFPDHELAPSVQFELDHLGKDINEIDVLKHITS